MSSDLLFANFCMLNEENYSKRLTPKLTYSLISWPEIWKIKILLLCMGMKYRISPWAMDTTQMICENKIMGKCVCFRCQKVKGWRKRTAHWEFSIFILNPIVREIIRREDSARAGTGKWETRTLWSENLKARDHYVDLSLHEWIVLR
jgi:hypothetical protein